MSILSPVLRPVLGPVVRRVTDARVGGGFSPASIGNLSMWLDASTLTGADGATVATWPDRSGNGNDATAAGTPTNAVTSGLNGKRAVRLNGTNAKFTTPAFVGAGYGNAISVFMVLLGENHTDNRIAFSAAGLNFRFDINGGTLATNFVADGITGDGTGANHGNSGVLGITVGPATLSVGLDRVWLQSGGQPRNGSASATTRALTGTVPFTGNALTIGALGTGFYYPGLVGEVLVYNKQLSAAEYQKVASYLATKWGFCAKPLIVCMGNSLTSGQGSTGGAGQDTSATGNNYPSRLLSALSATHDVRTDAYPGRNLTQLIEGVPLFGDVMVTRNGVRQIAIAWEISNTLRNGATKEATLDQLAAFCLARKAAGFSVLVGTCLNRGDGGVNFDADRQWINAQILTGFAAYADGVVDFAAVPELSDYTNVTYFDADTIHLTDAGYQVVADTVAAKLAALGW